MQLFLQVRYFRLSDSGVLILGEREQQAVGLASSLAAMAFAAASIYTRGLRKVAILIYDRAPSWSAVTTKTSDPQIVGFHDKNVGSSELISAVHARAFDAPHTDDRALSPSPSPLPEFTSSMPVVQRGIGSTSPGPRNAALRWLKEAEANPYKAGVGVDGEPPERPTFQRQSLGLLESNLDAAVSALSPTSRFDTENED